MSGFEFIFSLMGLLLGLALAEGLGGLARCLKSQHLVRIGWPTALLGIFVSCDVVSFWMYGWALREMLPITWPVLFGGFLLTAVYYVSASLVFPNDIENCPDLGAHFDRNRRKVLAGIGVCNVVLVSITIALFPQFPLWTLRTILMTWSFFPITLLAIIARDRRLSSACLVALIASYPVSAVWT